jgi:hypothetical protein
MDEQWSNGRVGVRRLFRWHDWVDCITGTLRVRPRRRKARFQAGSNIADFVSPQQIEAARRDGSGNSGRQYNTDQF